MLGYYCLFTYIFILCIILSPVSFVPIVLYGVRKVLFDTMFAVAVSAHFLKLY